jgi:hypothetical protein
VSTLKFQATHLRVSLYIGSSLRARFLTDQTPHVSPDPFPNIVTIPTCLPSNPSSAVYLLIPAIICLSTSNCHQLLGQFVFLSLLAQIPDVWKYQIFFLPLVRLIQPCLGEVPPLSFLELLNSRITTHCEACSHSRLFPFALPVHAIIP